MNMDLPTKDTHIEHSKVNSILYTCPFVHSVDGILLDPPLPCILRLKSYTCVMEEVGRKRTTTPSTREAWKRRRKKRKGEEAAPLQTSDDFRTSNTQRNSDRLKTEGSLRRRTSNRLRTSEASDVRNPTDVRRSSASTAKTPTARCQCSHFRTSEG